MKWRFAIGIVAIVALAASCQMLAQTETPENEIRTTLKHVVDAALKGDTSALDRLLADDFTRIQSDGKERTKAQILEGFKTGNIKFVVFDEADVKVRMYGDVGVVTSTANMTMRSPDGKEVSGQFRNSRVFVKHDGQWQVALFQSSKIT